MELTRSSGILMPISSLYGSDSIGCFGKEARQFVDLLSEGGFTWWQVLPFCMTDDCNSPYKSYSAFGGNPYFIDIRELASDGYLSRQELDSVREQTPYACEYERLAETRLPLLRLAASRADREEREHVRAFAETHPQIEQFCTFMAIRAANDQKPWYEWTTNTMDESEHFAWQFMQYRFFRQWSAVHDYARRRGIRILGDIPIYVAYDSADVWANRELFQLNPDDGYRPVSVAGCPPDYFSKNGQLWGNPLYRWDRMAGDGFSWWQARMKHMFHLFDGVRIDHFRGLEAYWSIPADAETACDGHWVEGPGKDFIRVLHELVKREAEENGRDVLIVAEDLGESTPSLRRFVQESGFPSMRVFQFGFDGNPANPHLPHNYERRLVAYTGTHDNNTLLGFIWESDETTRRKVLTYCGFDGENWDCPAAYASVIRTLFASSAGLTILPLQDVLGYGADTRMNIPGNPSGNWRYRVTEEQLKQIDLSAYRELNERYGRLVLPNEQTAKGDTHA